MMGDITNMPRHRKCVMIIVYCWLNVVFMKSKVFFCILLIIVMVLVCFLILFLFKTLTYGCVTVRFIVNRCLIAVIIQETYIARVFLMVKSFYGTQATEKHLYVAA